MAEIELKASNREVLGKKVRFLRRQGMTPVHLFGHGVESLALQCDTTNLRHVLAEAGMTRLIDLKVGRERSPRTVLVREIQTQPLTGEMLHVDFYQVQMAEEMRVEVPIVFVGEAPALKLKENMLTHELTSLTIECLPAQIPASIEVDVSSLSEVEQAIRVQDIELDEGVHVITDPEHVVVRITQRHVEKEEEVEVEEEVVAEAEAAEAPAEETEE